MIGQTLAMEGMFAFLLESAFIGVLVWGEKRLGPRLHFLAALGVATGSWLSGYFILVTNAFMQHPVGHAMAADGTLVFADIRAYLLNEWALIQFAHNQAAALVTGTFAVTAVGAFYAMRGVHRDQARLYALVIQFKHAAKPFIVFAGIPFGIAGALGFLVIMGTPFGFMAFLGIASLIGVIVSHVVVLFDFIEEAHERGESLEEALLDAGIVRLRPVLITVAATVIALIPLAMHGGPLWVPMCYAQIGGLTVATFVTLVLVPVIYAIFVKDLKLVKWETVETHVAQDVAPVSTPTPVVVQAL